MIKATAPVRICDNGGWTDTWFGGPGRVLNIAVSPGVEVSISSAEGSDPVVLCVEAFGDRYPVLPGAIRFVRHQLLESAIDTLPPPRDLPVEITVRSAVPAGCGTGTSAAVTVAMLGALARARSEQPSQREVAYAAHRLEVDVLGTESGVQDQLSSAFGGINFIEVDQYPEAKVQALPMWPELDHLLTLVFCGRAHDSGQVHNQVIDNAEGHRPQALSRMREAAVSARDAVLTQDLHALGQAMIANTEAQRPSTWSSWVWTQQD
jgi:D-glycero-alpha-D-manno-heptose-7-phosphate kinase